MNEGVPWWKRRDVWVTKDRRVIPIRELDDDHLSNIISFLRRQAAKVIEQKAADILVSASSLQGEMAIDSMDRELTAVMNTSPQEVLESMPIYDALCDEADRRALAQGMVPAPDEYVSPSSPVYRRALPPRDYEEWEF